MKTMTRGPVIHRSGFRSYLNEYSAQRFPKEAILLHGTSTTSARSVCKGWGNLPRGPITRTKSSYVVDQAGAICEMYQPEFWARHIGMESQNPDLIHDRRTIGIDLVNPGPLRVDGADPRQMNWLPNQFRARYCGAEETDKYIAADFRGESYFGSYPLAQIAALRFLMERLGKQFDIPMVAPPPEKRMVCDPDYFLTYRGIASVQNLRNDRFDVGPAFDWSWLGT